MSTTEVDPQQNRMAMYKKKGEKIDQATRRKQLLEEQKQRRYDYLNHVRMIAAMVGSQEEASDMDLQTQSSKNQVDPPPKWMDKRERKKYYRKQHLLDNQLMHSEWMTTEPEDFETEWMLVPCPKGKRSLVVASGGITTAYSKSGYVLNTFPSNLPGGNGRYVEKGKDFTIIDAILNESQRTYYILDIMCWKDHPIYDSETEFRFYWLHTKMQEVPLCFNKSKSNPYKFIPLPNYSCNRNNITAVMATPMNFELDGVLFYHKRGHYTFGQCPLVLWLKAHMMPDFLGIPVPDVYMKQMPCGYRGYLYFLEEMERNRQINQDRCEKGLAGVSKKKQKQQAQQGSEQEGSEQKQQQQQQQEKQTTSEVQTTAFVSGGMLHQNVPTDIITQSSMYGMGPSTGQ